MISFSLRNLKLFFKDKAAVFFSLLAVFIIIGLYALFLGDVWTDSFSDVPGARELMDTWMVAGLLAVTSVTTTMGAYGIMIDDKSKKIERDFIASPVKRRSLLGGYMASAVVIGIVMSFITLILAEVYLLAGGGTLPSIPVLLETTGLILLSTVANSAMVLFLVSFFQSSNAFATASTVIGTLIGFLTGIYIPVGTLPEAVQFVIKCFPTSHAAVLFRKALMEQRLEASFAGAPAETASEFEEFLGVTFRFGDTPLSSLASIAVLIGTAILFYALALLLLSRRKIQS